MKVEENKGLHRSIGHQNNFDSNPIPEKKAKKVLSE